MSPEYAMDGLFSEKSDVFSFGVMMLEIISGKKNTGFYQFDRCLNLLGYVSNYIYSEAKCCTFFSSSLSLALYCHNMFVCTLQAWDLWKEGRGVELMDQQVKFFCDMFMSVFCAFKKVQPIDQ